MRDIHTPEETLAVAALGEYIKNEGYADPVPLDGWTDKPDCIFTTNRGRIACEIATLLPDTIIHWYFKKHPELPAGTAREIVLPREPHQWAMRIVKDKNSKFGSYRDRSKTRNIWLLLHASNKASNILRPASKEDLDLMKCGVALTKHKFKRVLFYDGIEKVTELYNHKWDIDARINYSLESGYPTYVIREVSMGHFAGIPEGTYSEIKVDFNELETGDQIIAPPLDPRYSKNKPNIAIQDEPMTVLFGEIAENSQPVGAEVSVPEFHKR